MIADSTVLFDDSDTFNGSPTTGSTGFQDTVRSISVAPSPETGFIRETMEAINSADTIRRYDLFKIPPYLVLSWINHHLFKVNPLRSDNDLESIGQQEMGPGMGYILQNKIIR